VAVTVRPGAQKGTCDAECGSRSETPADTLRTQPWHADDPVAQSRGITERCLARSVRGFVRASHKVKKVTTSSARSGPFTETSLEWKRQT
jgi:hypothetical protein